MLSKKRRASGFTIIELVLVLAIAAIIFMIIFMAIPAMQRSQRDTQRRNDLALLKGAIDNWRTNNVGRTIDNDTRLQMIASQYFNEPRDPTTANVYTLQHRVPSQPNVQTSDLTSLGVIIFAQGHVCDPNGGADLIKADNVGSLPKLASYAILTKLEGGGQSFCLDSH